MFAWWGRTVVRLRWALLAAGLALAILGGTWGAGVFGELSGGGFADRDSASSRARERIAAEVGSEEIDVLAIYTSDTATADEPGFRDAIVGALAKIRPSPSVASVASWYDTRVPHMVSTDRRSVMVIIQLAGTDEQRKLKAYEEIRPLLDIPGRHVDLGGKIAQVQQSNAQTKADVARAETLSLPVLLLFLVLIFGGIVAAGTPLLVGALGILGAFISVRILTLVTDVSTFAINVITLIGLGLAIDYALFVVSRFREELAAGREVPAAVVNTMATAGRTVLVSGLTVAVALSSLLIFPQPLLRSMGLGGVSAVIVAMLAALTVLPALLAVLGPRIDAGRIPLPWLKERDPAATGLMWVRIARSVMRRPVLYAGTVIALLLLLATPFLRVEFGGFDERVMPSDAGARVVAERVKTEFSGGSIAPIEVLVSGGSAAQVTRVSGDISRVPGVTGVQTTASRGGSTLLSVRYDSEPASGETRDIVAAIRALPAPDGAEVVVAGRPAADLDLLTDLRDRLPWMAAMMASATCLLLFLAFGSVLLPIKAVLMNLVSIGASFGVIIWIFQDGHLADLLGFTPTGFIGAGSPILMLAVLFGLATDYEVFLLSRIREEWDRTGDNTAAVTLGLQRTGRIITAAALLLIVVVAGFSTGEIAIIKLVGVGMIVGVVVDATLVRALLVPATMRLLGRWNWWAPGPLARVYRRYGIRESSEPVEARADDRVPVTVAS